VGLIATAAIAGSVIWNALGQRYPAVPVVTGVVVTTAACLVGIGGLYWLLLYPSYLRSVFSGQVMAAGEMELSIDSASMTSKVGSERTTVAWPGVTVVNRPRHYFLFYSRFNAIILPKRAFTGEPDHTHFTRLIEGNAKLMSPQ
jgi:hypothetical protein